jgi:hypothetical protein
VQLPDNDRDDLAFRLLIVALTIIVLFGCIFTFGVKVWLNW